MSIKLFIQMDKFQDGGPGTFRKRLIDAFSRIEEVDIVTDVKKNFDIELAFIRKIYKHDKPYILRVGNCWYIKKYKTYNNKPIEKAIRRSKHVIFQSNFAYKLLKQTLRLRNDCPNGKNLKYSIIYNGVNIDYIKSISPAKNIIPGSFFSCARWDPNKRPLSTIKGFLEAGTKRHLYMIGGQGVEGRKDNYKFKSKYIHFLGPKSNKEIISIMKACNYQIHLCHIDACPNIVIEGLICGLNVLCTNLGGTRELVKKDGVVLDVDPFLNTRYMKPRNVDNLKPRKVAKGIEKLMKIKTKPNRPDLDINLTAKKYLKIIKKNLK